MTNLVMDNPTITRDETLEKKIQEWIRLQWTKYSESTDDSSTYTDQNYDDDDEFDGNDDLDENEFDQEDTIRKL